MIANKPTKKTERVAISAAKIEVVTALQRTLTDEQARLILKVIRKGGAAGMSAGRTIAKLCDDWLDKELAE